LSPPPTKTVNLTTKWHRTTEEGEILKKISMKTKRIRAEKDVVFQEMLKNNMSGKLPRK